MTLLEVENIAVDIGDVRAVEDVSLQVGAGQLVAVVGGNGAGKTTTLRAISGLAQLRSGRITFDGTDLATLAPHDIVERGIAQVPEGRRLFPQMSVRENLVMGAFGRRGRPHLRTNLDAVLDRFPRVRERLEQRAGTLSGGEQQQVAIGRALMTQPRLLMFDEPSLALDPKTVEQVFAVIDTLHAEGMAVLLVEQNIAHALSRADVGYVVERGRTVHAGPGNEVLKHPTTRAAYLGA